MNDSNVVAFPTAKGSTNRQCPVCGGEWWTTQGIVIDAATDECTGYAAPLECVSCAKPGELRSI